MKKLLIGILFLGLSSLSHSQASAESNKLELDGITLMPANMSYLSIVNAGTKALRVIKLQKEVASYDIKKSPTFNNKTRLYKFGFEQRDDHILATYDRQGRVVHSYEKYKDIVLNQKVREAMYRAYPGWSIAGNTYIVTYALGQKARKSYRIKIEKDKKQKRVKIDAEGNLL